MIDLSKGIIEIEGVIVSRETQKEIFIGLNNPKIKVTVTDRGNVYVRFLTPITSNGIDMYVEVFFSANRNGPKITLFPSVNSDADMSMTVSEHRLTASKKWLKGMMDCAPATDCKEGIGYVFDDCRVSAFICKDPFYGYVGGEIKIVYEN